MSQPRPRTSRHRRRRRRRRHPRHRRRRQHAHAVERAAAEQHAAEARQVAGRAEQPGMPGHAAHPPRGRIVHHAAQRRRPTRPLARPRPSGVAALGRRDPRPQRRGRQEPRVAHPERREDCVASCTRPASAPLTRADDLAEQEEVDVAVDEALAGRGGRHLVARQFDGRVVAGPRLGEVDVRPQARDVGHQVANA